VVLFAVGGSPTPATPIVSSDSGIATDTGAGVDAGSDSTTTTITNPGLDSGFTGPAPSVVTANAHKAGPKSKQRRLALRSALTTQAQDGHISVLSGFDLETPRTAAVVELLRNIEAGAPHRACMPPGLVKPHPARKGLAAAALALTVLLVRGSRESIAFNTIAVALKILIVLFFIAVWLAPLLVVYRSLRLPSLEMAARLDSKTELFNARYFAATLAEELGRAQRFERPLTLIMADLDLLREVNNTYGHLAGDAVLTGVAEQLILDPQHPRTLYALTQGTTFARLYRTDDAGVTWRALWHGDYTSNLSLEGHTLYLARSDGIYISTDRGGHWHLAVNPRTMPGFVAKSGSSVAGMVVQALHNGYLRHPSILDHIDTYIVPPGLGPRSGVLGALELARRALQA